MANNKSITYAGAINLIGNTIPFLNASDLAIQSMASNKLITYAKAKALIDTTVSQIAPPTTNGIYIVDKNRKFYKTSEWNTANNSNASGVAVINASANFIISPQPSASLRWGGEGIYIPIPAYSSDDFDAAINDYAGETNTTAIIKTLGVYGTAAVAAAMYIEEDIAAANNEASAIPQTLSLEDDLDTTNVFDSEEYSTLLDKQAEGTLSEEEFARLSELNSLRIKQEFMEKYNIANDTVLYILLEKIRQRLKTNIDIAQSNLPEKYVDTKDVDHLSHDGIMVMMLENDNTQSKEDPVVYGADNGSNYAANYCRNYIFKHGKAGFLPALGQLRVIFDLRSSINSALSLIGGTQLENEYGSSFWTSTQGTVPGAYDYETAWYMNWNYGNTSHTYRSRNYWARPICSF